MPVRLAPWARKMSGTRAHAPSVTSTKRARTRGRMRATESDREGYREKERERERERDGSEHRGRKPSTAGKNENKLYSEKLEKAGTVDVKSTPRGRWGQGPGSVRPKVPGRFAFPGARNPGICSTSQFGKNFPAIFPGLSRSFPREPPNRAPETATAFSSFLIYAKICSGS